MGRLLSICCCCLSTVLSFSLVWGTTQAFLSPTITHRNHDCSCGSPLVPLLHSSEAFASNNLDENDDDHYLDEQLLTLAKKLKLNIFDLDQGIFGLDSQDPQYGIENIKTSIRLGSYNNGSIGLVLSEMASHPDGRGLVMVRHVTGNAAQAHPAAIMPGDVITGVFVVGNTNNILLRQSTTALNYDRTVAILGQAKEMATSTTTSSNGGEIVLQLNRIVERAKIEIEINDGSGVPQTITALAGEDLRRLLLRKGIKMYDRNTKRFDMPFAKGDCAGEGLCGTCLVAIKEGANCLNQKGDAEKMITKGRPLSWRAACRTIVGADNKGGKLKIQLSPQSNFEDELNPGVKEI